MSGRSADELLKLAFTELNLADNGERSSWLQHPCTRALIHYLNADVLAIQENWSNGSYTTEDMYGTVQLNSEALGQFKAVSNVLDFVEGVNDEEMFEDDNT